ncbi:ABC transporter permease [Bdellovibrio bacteriovorus]|uniref:ABC transporter, permease protein n=2 Tax=Bdellovibrio bacteriovorus TaxID=959 RepID=Q6MHX3_BDEBA|nr:ABC transporter permease [Bdellovibrio bacteriovorus]CAE78209.1 ABC transporter, permease protein [Bdellovibrio bacteriovorus HD100]
MNNLALPFTVFMMEVLFFIGGVGLLSRDVFRETIHGRIYYKLISEQIYQIGMRSLPLIVITAVSIGMVMSLQFGMGLEKFGGKLYVPKLLAVTILREMGPVFTSLMLAARVGAGIASEIGSMVVTQQIDAIRALGTSPIKKIVIPRVLACLITLPILVSIANIVGNLGGLIIGATELNLDPNFYYLKVMTTSNIQDYLSGFAKTFFFAIFIAIPSCYFGLNVKAGTKEVGIATTKAVVVSSILIVVGDFFLSKLFWIVEKMI